MDDKTEQNIISYVIAIIGCSLIGFFSNPNGLAAFVCVLIGIVMVGFAGTIQGSINN